MIGLSTCMAQCRNVHSCILHNRNFFAMKHKEYMYNDVENEKGMVIVKYNSVLDLVPSSNYSVPGQTFLIASAVTISLSKSVLFVTTFENICFCWSSTKG